MKYAEADNSGCDVGINMTTVLYLIKSSFKSIFFLIVRERSHIISAPSPRKIGRNRRLGFLILTLGLKIMC